jgi:hypothetical protein
MMALLRHGKRRNTVCTMMAIKAELGYTVPNSIGSSNVPVASGGQIKASCAIRRHVLLPTSGTNYPRTSARGDVVRGGKAGVREGTVRGASRVWWPGRQQRSQTWPDMGKRVVEIHAGRFGRESRSGVRAWGSAATRTLVAVIGHRASLSLRPCTPPLTWPCRPYDSWDSQGTSPGRSIREGGAETRLRHPMRRKVYTSHGLPIAMWLGSGATPRTARGS